MVNKLKSRYGQTLCTKGNFRPEQAFVRALGLFSACSPAGAGWAFSVRRESGRRGRQFLIGAYLTPNAYPLTILHGRPQRHC